MLLQLMQVTIIMKLVSKLVLLVFLLLFLISITNTNQYVSVILQKAYGYCNKKYCNISVVCRPLNRTSKWTKLDIYFHKGVKVNTPIYVEFSTSKKFRTEYRQHMIKVKEELCNLLKNYVGHPLFVNLWKHDGDGGNIFHQCPLTGHRYLDGKVINDDTFGYIPLVPVGEWRLDIVVSKNINQSEEVILSWSEFYEVKPKGVIEF